MSLEKDGSGEEKIGTLSMSSRQSERQLVTLRSRLITSLPASLSSSSILPLVRQDTRLSPSPFPF